MTTLLDEAIAEVRKLPEAEQDLAAEVLLQIAHRSDVPYRLTPEQEADVARIKADLKAGRTRLMTDEEVEAMWRRFGI